MYQPIDVDKHRLQAPSVLHSAAELPRALLELTSLAYAWPWLGAAPRGDGHTVLVLPGFTAGDESTLLLRGHLGRLGYRVMPWGLGRNTGSPDLQERLVERVAILTDEHDGSISLVGQSLGGVFARELARRFEGRVRQVVTLGSPFASVGPESTNALVGRLFRSLSGMSRDEMRERARAFDTEPPPVPSTAVYSRSDGIVHWSSCLEYEGVQAENVEIIGSHTGMALNPLVLHVLADRLAQPEGRWRPFDRSRGWRAAVYPEPSAASRQQSNGTQPCES